MTKRFGEYGLTKSTKDGQTNALAIYRDFFIQKKVINVNENEKVLTREILERGGLYKKLLTS